MPQTVQVELNGQVIAIEVPDGVDPSAAVDEVAAAQGGVQSAAPVADTLPELPSESDPLAPLPEKGLGESIMDRLGAVGDFAKGTFADATGRDVQPGEGGLESAQRGVGLTARTAVGAIPRTATGLGDLLSMIVNAGDRGLQNVFGFDNPDLLPTDNTAQLDAVLNEFFPEPTGMAERAASLGGEMLMTGGTGGLALARNVKPGMVRPSITPKQLKGEAAVAGEKVRPAGGVVEDIAHTFAARPGAAVTAEFGGGAGASVGGDVAEELEAGPLGQLIATLLGGFTGSLAPQALAGRGGQIAALSRRAVEPFRVDKAAATPSDRIVGGAGRRAAVELQSRAHDPEAAATAAREAPEGVLPARATDDPNLMALESRVLTDDPVLEARTAANLEMAEVRALRDLTGDLPEGVSRSEWQQTVVQRASPEGVTIDATDPDMMMRQARDGFTEAYDVARGHPVRNVEHVPGQAGTRMPEAIEDAISDTAVLADEGIRDRIFKWVTGRYEAMLERPTAARVSGSADNPLVNLTSDDLIDLRHAVREQQRRRFRAGHNGNPDAEVEAELLNNVDDAITRTLHSHLPDDVRTQMQATDLRYRDFKTVEAAVVRSGEKGLTPEQLRMSVRQRATVGAVARGETGDVGTLAERGKDLTTLFGKKGKTDDQIRRAMRTMDEPTASASRADITRHLVTKASPADVTTGQPRLSGKGLQTQIEQNASALRAAGFTDADVGRMEQIAQRLVTIQQKSPTASTQLINDHLGFLSGLVSRVAGAKFAKRVTAATGTGGPGVLALTGFGSRMSEKLFKNLSFDGAQKLLSDAVADPELFAALLTRPTSSGMRQVRANRQLNAWLAQNGFEAAGEE